MADRDSIIEASGGLSVDITRRSRKQCFNQFDTASGHLESCSSVLCTTLCKLMQCFTIDLSAENVASQLLLLLKRNTHGCAAVCVSKIASVVQSILLRLSQADSKLVKILIQILVWLKKANCQQVDNVLSQLLSHVSHKLVEHAVAPSVSRAEANSQAEGCLGFSEGKFYSLLLCCLLCDAMPLAREMWYSYCRIVLPHLCSEMDKEIHGVTSWTLSRQQYMHVLVKVTLQTCQCLIMNGKVDQLNIDQDFSHLLDTCVALLSAADDALPRECLLIAGSIIGLLVEFTKASCVLSDVFHDLFNKLSCDPARKPSFGQLCLIHGFLAHCDEVRLSSEAQRQGCSTNLHSEMYPLIVEMCLVANFKYHSFGVLQLWYRKLLTSPKLSSSDNSSSTTRIVSSFGAGNLTPLVNVDELLIANSRSGGTGMLDAAPSCDSHMPSVVITIMDNTMNLIVGHADCNVDGVNDSISAILNTMFKIDVKLSVTLSSDGLSPMLSAMLIRIRAIPWHSKAKYVLLNAILNYLPYSQVTDNCAQVMDDVCRCLSTNFLAPVAALVYQTLIKIICSQSDGLKVWFTCCWPAVHRAVTSSNRLINQNACQQLLPFTLRVFPESLQLMLDVLKKGNNDLKASILILSTAKSVIGDVKLRMDLVESALESADIDVRSAAFRLLCTSRRSTDSLSADEIAILTTHLQLSLNCDEPAYRIQLLASVQSANVRVRDSSLSCLRRKTKTQTDWDLVNRAIDFIDCLWTLCIQNMSPGSNYQRLDTCLGIIRLILDSFESRPHQTQRKGNIPGDVNLFLTQGRDREKLMFFNEISLYAIFGCIFSSADEIRIRSAEILRFYFPWPLSQSDFQLSAKCLLTSGLTLCSSVKSVHSDSGALICALVYSKSAVSESFSFKITKEDVDDGSQHANEAAGRVHFKWVLEESCRGNYDADCYFISQLVDQIEAGVNQAVGNAAASARDCPLHGLLLAVNCCLRLGINSCGTSVDCWRSVVRKLLTLIQRLLDTVLNLFGGKLESSDSAPSFEHISRAIDEVVQSDSSANDDVDLDACRQLVHSWCWLNIREAGLLLGVVTKTFAGVPEPSVLSVDEVYCIGRMFLHILTHCRHRGAIEGCCIGFSMYCSTLFNSSQLSLHGLPRKLLEDVLLHVSAQSMSSVTRRSAGLPLIVNSLLASEIRCKQTTLLDMLVKHLVAIVSRPIKAVDQLDESRDVVEVHALNILRSVVQESSTSLGVSQYYAVLTIHAIDGFMSPFWPIRNASLQLLGSLLPKMLGEKKTRSDDFHVTPSDSFFIRFPRLADHIEEILQSAVVDQSDNVLNVRLFPVLSILCRLSPGLVPNRELDKLTTSLQGSLVELASSSLHSVRSMSSHALVGLVPLSSAAEFVRDVVRSLPASRATTKSFNRLHGTLLQIEYILTSLKHSDRLDYGDDIAHEIVQSLMARCWIASSSRNPCPLVRAVFMRIADIFLECFESEDISGGARRGFFIVPNAGDEADPLCISIAHTQCKREMNQLDPGEWLPEGVNKTTVPRSAAEAGHNAVIDADAGRRSAADADHNAVMDADAELKMVSISTLHGKATKKILTEYVETNVAKEIESVLKIKSARPPMIGESVWIRTLVGCYLVNFGDDSSLLTSRVERCLNCCDVDVIHSALSFLVKNSTKCSISCLATIHEHLQRFMVDPSTPQHVLIATLSLLERLYRASVVVQGVSPLDAPVLWHWVAMFEGSHQRGHLAMIALRLLSILVKYLVRTTGYRDLVEKWFLVLAKHSYSEMPDDMRLNAAECLAFTVESVSLDHLETSSPALASRLLKLLFHLLSDSQAEIRTAAALAVSHILQITSIVHSNRAAELLLDYMLSNTCRTSSSVSSLYGWLVYDDSQHSLESFCTTRFTSLFDADDLNPFHEACLNHRLVTSRLQNIFFDFDFGWLSGEIDRVTSLLHHATTVLDSIPKQERLFKCYNKLFYETVHSLSCRARLLMKWSKDIDLSCGSQLKIAYTRMSSISGFNAWFLRLNSGLRDDGLGLTM